MLQENFVSCSKEREVQLAVLSEFIHIPTFIYTALNLVILYFILKRLLFKPVWEFMENRKNSIAESMEKAEKGKAEALELKNKYESELNEAYAKAQKILKEAEEKAKQEYERIIRDAKMKPKP